MMLAEVWQWVRREGLAGQGESGHPGNAVGAMVFLLPSAEGVRGHGGIDRAYLLRALSCCQPGSLASGHCPGPHLPVCLPLAGGPSARR